MTQSSLTTEARFATIVEALLGSPDVTPPMGQGFGASGLRVREKFFAMLSSGGAFVVKLPKARVDALVAAWDRLVENINGGWNEELEHLHAWPEAGDAKSRQ
jgi:hypothetical protein